MKIYHYTDTGEFSGAADARIDPLETEAQGKEVYLTPRNATPIVPPATGKNETAFFTDGKWTVQPDYRGKTFYAKETGMPVKITNIGEPPDDLTPIKPVPYAVWEKDAWVESREVWLNQLVRPGRNARLAACDYVMMPDYPLSDKSKWEAYRQALRDLPATLSEIVDPVPWPKAPAK